MQALREGEELGGACNEGGLKGEGCLRTVLPRRAQLTPRMNAVWEREAETCF